MRRRAFLSLLAAGATATAGCVGEVPATGRSDDAATETPTPLPENVHLEPGEWFETDRGRAIALEHVRVHRSVAYFGGVHTDVIAEDGVQYVVVEVAFQKANEGTETATADPTTTELMPLDGMDFVTLVDGEPNPAGSPVRNVVLRSRYGQSNLVGFPVPVEPAPGSVSLGWMVSDERTVYWDLGPDALATLARSPAFEVRSFEVPERATPEERIEVSVTVANVGERDGTFVAELGNAAISDQPEIFLDVPAGETVTHTGSIRADAPGRDEMPVRLDWGAGSMERTVTIDRATTGG